jgi:transposase-like protein
MSAEKKQKKPMTSTEYVADGGGRCPFCRSREIEGSQHDYEGDKVYQNITCRSCNREWTDIYALTGYDVLEIGLLKDGVEGQE